MPSSACAAAAAVAAAAASTACFAAAAATAVDAEPRAEITARRRQPHSTTTVLALATAAATASPLASPAPPRILVSPPSSFADRRRSSSSSSCSSASSLSPPPPSRPSILVLGAAAAAAAALAAASSPSPAAAMPEFRHMRSGSLSIPAAAAAGPGAAQMMARSPPSASYRLAPALVPAEEPSMRRHVNLHRHNLLLLHRQLPALHHQRRRKASDDSTPDSADRRAVTDTSHVPCKFFRQGACQAGNACPFSHDIGASAETVCKYFAKGNCKFGPKCANVHVLPDGRRINYGKNGVTIGTSPLNLASRSSPGSASPTSASATAYNSHGASASALTSSLYQYPSAYSPDDRHLSQHHGLDGAIPAIDMPYPHSNYDSPRDDDAARLGFGRSPVNGKGLSVLDAPLPSSFDSNGISNAARFPSAPWPSSVPSKFGLDSPTLSLSSARESPRASETLKLLHTSAFGSSEHLATPTPGSPPNSQPVNGDEYFGKRTMHSSRYAKPRMLSSSLPKAASVDRDWEAGFAFGDDGDNVPENYVPENLQDLLTPAEKARRGSMRADNDFAADGLTKYGSPLGSSPSRWGPLFQRQKEDEDATRAARNAGSAFGHVGSPLRKSTLAQEMGDGFKSHPSAASRPLAQRAGSESMSVLSQQLQRSRLDDGMGGSSPLLHPTTARISGGGMSAMGKDRAMERHVSSGSIGSSMTGRFTTPIDEEDPAFVFSMEDEDDSGSARGRKRASAGLTMGGLGSYAGAAAAKGAGSASKDPRDAMPVEGR